MSPFSRRVTRVLIAAGLVAPAVVPLLAQPSAATPPTITRATAVYVADTNGDFYYGIYAAPASNPTARQAVLPESTAYDVLDAAVSPDGTKVAAEVDRVGDGDYSLEVIDVATRAHHLVQTASHTRNYVSGANILGVDWSRDGTTVLYGMQKWSTSPGGTVSYANTLMTRPADDSTSPVTVAGSTGLAYPEYNPAGTKVVASHIRGFGGGLYVLDLGTHAVTELIAAASNARFRNPTWSPDGTTIVASYAHFDSTGHETYADLWSADPTISNQQGGEISPSRNNTRYAYQRPSFSMDGSVWSDRIDVTHCCIGDLFQAHLYPRGGWSFSNRTNTATVDEASASFARPLDDGAPTAAATITGVTLDGPNIVLHWTVPPGLDDYASVDVHIVDVTSGQTGTWHHIYGTSWSFPVTLGSTDTFTIPAIFDGTGNQGPASSGSITAIAAGAKIFVTSPATTQNRVLPIGMRWGWTQQAGVTYDVTYKVKTAPAWGFGPTTNWQSGVDVYSAPFTPGVAGQTYYVQSTVHDSYGNVTSSATTPINIPYDQTIGHYSRGWVTLKETLAWLGSIAATSTNGVSATYTVTGKQEMVIGDKCASCGKFAVYLDGHYKATVSTYSYSTKPVNRQVLWHWTNAAIGSHTIKLVALLTKGQTLRIDAVADPR